LIFIAILLLSDAAAGDTGMRIGARQWYGDIDGAIRFRSDDPANDVDLNRDLGYDNTRSGNYYLRLEHPLPLLPNAMLSKTDIEESTSSRLSRTFDFGGSSFTVGEDVDSSVQYRQSDVILYYNILDTGASLDVGVDARYIDSNTSLSDSNGAMETARVSGWIPLLYAGVDIALPLTGLSLGAEGSFIGYQDHHLYDVTLHASYTSPWKAGADLGYRRLKLGLDDFDDYSTDIEFSGPYAGVFVKF
jgi:outer membrane protein